MNQRKTVMVERASAGACQGCSRPTTLLYRVDSRAPAWPRGESRWVCEKCKDAFANPCFHPPAERTPEAMQREEDRAWAEWAW